MVKSILLAIGLSLSLSANASVLTETTYAINNVIFGDVEMAGVFDWKVGDQADYNLKMSFLSGSMIMKVAAVSADEVVLTQDISMMGQKQSCETKINPQTGETKSLICNGQQQDTNQGNVEIIETKEDTVRVPAGTFTCMYIKAKTQAQGQETIVQQWINPKQVPVMGLVKTVAPSQMGEVVVELKSFKKN